jgi:hypothetical protein
LANLTAYCVKRKKKLSQYESMMIIEDKIDKVTTIK